MSASPGTLRTWPLAASPSHSSTEAGVTFWNAKRVPSGDHEAGPGQAPSGSATRVCLPLAMSTTVKSATQEGMP